MLIDPKVVVSRFNNCSIEEIIHERKRILKEISIYENKYILKKVYNVECEDVFPSKETLYQYNNELLIQITNLLINKLREKDSEDEFLE